MKASAILAAAILSVTPVVAQSQLTIPPFSNTFSGSLTRGYWFQCPTNIIITGLQVPDETNHGLQNVEVFVMQSAPPQYAGTATGGQVFYQTGVPSNQIIQTQILVNAGEYVGVLGACGDASTMYNSYSGPGPHAATILGQPVTLDRFLTQFNIVSSGGNQAYSSETGGSLGRVDLWYTPQTGIFSSFTATPTSGASPLAVQFTDTSFSSDPGGILSWTWDFGDGSAPVNTQNPSHTYAACGDYTVSLTVTDMLNGSNTNTKTNYISVDPSVTDFVASTTAGAAPLAVTFTDLSTGGPTSWSWDFGDGSTPSNLQNPTHTYTANGVYTVTLTTSNTCRSSSETKTNYIAVIANDDCTTAIPVVDGANGPFSNVGATTDPLYPWPCAGSGGSDVYFSYTASCNGNVTVDTCGAGYDTALEIFDGSQGCAGLLSIICNDDNCGLQSSATVTNVMAGATLIIRVGGYNGAQGTFPLNISCSGPSGNDECAQAVALTDGLNGPFDNLTATTSAPAWPCASGGNDVWFSYSATCPGSYEFTTCSIATYDTCMELFDGAAGCTGLVSILCNDDACSSLQSSVTATLTAGNTYYLRVGGFAGNQGTFSVNVTRSGGSGSFGTAFPACGGLTLTPGGDPNIGGSVTYTLGGSGVQGQGFIWLGLLSIGTPICTGCVLGTEFTLTFSQNSIQGNLPCDISLVGGQYFTQGADLGSLAAGGCPAGLPLPFSLTMSDTIVTTVGM
ncbi:MAG: PKD domain-containing protein [Planctomycetes bacterium]|nr:PKD domain-containing protein [Planctomycetota bacterium]